MMNINGHVNVPFKKFVPIMAKITINDRLSSKKINDEERYD